MNVLFVNDGRWVAFCKRPDCNAAEQLWLDAPRYRRDEHGQAFGHPYGITSVGILHCGNCGLTSEVELPKDMNEIERLLGRRPVPQTRHWKPGESVADLRTENLLHEVGI